MAGKTVSNDGGDGQDAPAEMRSAVSDPNGCAVGGHVLDGCGSAEPVRPRFGEPCNGCGHCCIVQPCAIARYHLDCGPGGPCPALTLDDGRYRCGMVLKPSRYMKLPVDAAVEAAFTDMFASELGIGLGCCAAEDGFAWTN